MADKTLSGILCSVGVLYFGYIMGSAVYEGSAASHWRFTKGIVLGHGTSMDWTRKGSNYTPQVSYKYTVDGREYVSDRVSFPHPHSRGIKAARQFLKVYPENGIVTVYFDPQKPSEACLTNKISFDELNAPFIGFAILSVGAIYCFATSGPEKWR